MAKKGGSTPDRSEVQKKVSGTAFIEHSHGNAFFHGRAYNGPAADEAPQVTWQSKVLPRDDHGSTADWLTATEYCDTPEVMDHKCEQLAQLIQMSNKTVVYSGAGISVPALIGQAAKGSSGSGSKSSDAWPTKTHFALGSLGRHGLLHGWVQQNHDGLPQKAGFPQESINEIHGSWFDPSNPVVLYSGTLKGDSYPWMTNDAETADLVIVVGTSLGGLNADQVANKTAKRSLRNKPWKADGTGGALGTVIINLQQTEQDGKATLRMFGTTDTVLPRVMEKLGLAEVSACGKCGGKFCREPNGYMYSEYRSTKACHWDLNLLDPVDGTMHGIQKALFSPNDRKVVPYDKDGKRTKDGAKKMVLDLSNGAAIKITDGHNIQGAGQPAYLHIGASKPYTRPRNYGGETMQNGPGHGKVSSFSSAQSAFKLEIEGVTMTLGAWWLDAARRGAPETLPIVNLKPVFKADDTPSTPPPAAATTAGGAAPTAGGKAATPSPPPPAEDASRRTPQPEERHDKAPSTIEIGNIAQKADGDNWKWTVYVKGADVVETTFNLHPTFNPNKVTATADAEGMCSLSRVGWGTFDIRCDVTLKDGSVVKKVHTLEFRESGVARVYKL